ncbi:hypothetical protein Tco_0291509 [Tanacetum coccineum]
MSSDFASKFLNLDNVSPVIDEVASIINAKVRHKESSTPNSLSTCDGYLGSFYFSCNNRFSINLAIYSHSTKSTPAPTPTTALTTTSIPALLDFSSLFGFDQRVSTLEKELAQFKQVDHSAHILTSIKSQILVMVDEHLATRISFATQTARQSYTAEFEKKAQEEKDRYIDLVDKSIKDIIKDELRVNSLRSYQRKYQTLPLLIQKSKSFRGALEHRQLYDALIKSYKLDKDLFEPYGNTYSIKRDCDNKDQDEDPPAGSDQGLKKRKMSKDSVQGEEPVFEVTNNEISQDQGGDLGNKEDQPSVKTSLKHDCKIAQTEKPSLTFDELMSTPIDFSAYFMNNLKIDKLTQKILVGLAFKPSQRHLQKLRRT